MKDTFLSALGFVASAEGKYLGWSDEFRKFYSSGYRCPACNARLITVLGTTTVKFYTGDGEKLPLWQLAPLRAQVAECPQCGHRWKTRKDDASPSPSQASAVAVVETERMEEPIGSETRVIDNARSAVTLTRRFTVSKEWSRTYSVDYEKASVSNVGLKLGLNELSSFTAGFEQTIKERFSITRETKDVYSEEIEIQVPGSKRLTVVLNWKKIWQLGLLKFHLNGRESSVPFRVVIGITFDQSQVDGR